MVKHIIASDFPLGQVVVTRGIAANYMETTQGNIFINSLIVRHASKDFGDLCEEDIELNHEALEYGNRIFSLYEVDNDKTIYVLTEADRSVTTVLYYDEN